jgi:phage/plasmid-like protein (TIGR03299 family)
MAHNIYKEKFLTYRQPAWHGLGQVIQDEIGAVEAATRIQLPQIVTEPVVTLSGIATDYKAIIGKLAEGDTVYSVVSQKYHEIAHQTFLEVWDRAVKAHVETIGLLAGGAGLFLSAKIGTMDVKGDEIENYILAENWLNGFRSDKVRLTPQRVVCQNTLQLSDSRSILELIICHTRPAVEQLEKNLADVVTRTTSEYRALKEVFEILASAKVNDEQAKGLFTSVYPNLKQPQGLLARAATDADALDKLAAWERENGAQVEHRKSAFALFAGDGRGAQSEAAAGTAWGAYNAVAEYEQYLKKFRKAESIAFGAGKDRIAGAFDTVCEFAGVNAEA